MFHFRFELNLISKARNFIYGITILWIVFFHCGLSVNSSMLQTIKSYGDCGVEIFFLMSGIYLYFSYGKYSNIISFYKRRCIKVLPYYLIFYGVVFGYFNLVQTPNIKQFLLNYSMLDFWIHGLGNVPWFLASILVFYLIYPLIYKLFFMQYRYKIFWALGAIIGIGIICYAAYVYLPHLCIFIFRIPIFLIGCFLGKKIFDNKSLRFVHFMILIVIFIVTYILFKQVTSLAVLRNLFYIPLSIIIVLGLSLIYKLNLRFFPLLSAPFVYLGGYTLEIYLTHEKVQENLWRILGKLGFEVAFEDSIYQLSCIILSIAVSIILATLLRQIQNLFKHQHS